MLVFENQIKALYYLLLITKWWNQKIKYNNISLYSSFYQLKTIELVKVFLYEKILYKIILKMHVQVIKLSSSIMKTIHTSLEKTKQT